MNELYDKKFEIFYREKKMEEARSSAELLKVHASQISALIDSAIDKVENVSETAFTDFMEGDSLDFPCDYEGVSEPSLLGATTSLMVEARRAIMALSETVDNIEENLPPSIIKRINEVVRHGRYTIFTRWLSRRYRRLLPSERILKIALKHTQLRESDYLELLVTSSRIDGFTAVKTFSDHLKGLRDPIDVDSESDPSSGPAKALVDSLDGPFGSILASHLPRYRVCLEIMDRLDSEFEVIRRSRGTTTPDVLSEIDQIDSEAQFRAGISAPLFAVAIAAAIGFSIWFSALAALAVILALLAGKEAGDANHLIVDFIQVKAIAPEILGRPAAQDKESTGTRTTPEGPSRKKKSFSFSIPSMCKKVN
ncbi:hypothetical protein [Catenulispora yoronensis]